MLAIIVSVIIFLAFLTIGVRLLRTYENIGKTRDNGKAVKWQVNRKQQTEIISNKRLAALQRGESEGGILRSNDLIIVWAEEFLDDEILFETVFNNVANGIHYLYLLDVHHVDRFKVLLESLKKKIEPDIVNYGVNAIFLKSELTLNNFVMMGACSDHQKLYSSLIYDRQAFAWMEQGNQRATLFLLKVRRIVARMAVSQYFQMNTTTGEIVTTHRERISMYPTDNEHQIMNFGGFGETIANSKGGVDAVDEFPYDLREVVASSHMPEDSFAQLSRMGAGTAKA